EVKRRLSPSGCGRSYRAEWSCLRFALCILALAGGVAVGAVERLGRVTAERFLAVGRLLGVLAQVFLERFAPALVAGALDRPLQLPLHSFVIASRHGTHSGPLEILKFTLEIAEYVLLRGRIGLHAILDDVEGVCVVLA